MTTHDINLTIDRVKTMDDREMYNVSDAYVKGRLSRFAIDPTDQAALKQREMPKRMRESSLTETADVFEAVKKQVYDILYSPEILPRHRHSLDQMQRSVENQLSSIEDPHGDWRRAAQSFLDMVKDEIGRTEVVLERHRENSAQHFLNILVRAVREHQAAEDPDLADDRLYDITDQISTEMAALDPDDVDVEIDSDLAVGA
jgi:hypothetical protein